MMKKLHVFLVATIAIALLGCTKFRDLNTTGKTRSFADPRIKYLPADYVAFRYYIDPKSYINKNSIYGKVKNLVNQSLNAIWDENGLLISLNNTTFTYDKNGKLATINGNVANFNALDFYIGNGNTTEYTYNAESTKIIGDRYTNNIQYNNDTIWDNNSQYVITNGRLAIKYPIKNNEVIKDSLYETFTYDGNGNTIEQKTIASDRIYYDDTNILREDRRMRITKTRTYTRFNEVLTSNLTQNWMIFTNNVYNTKQHYEIGNILKQYIDYSFDTNGNWVKYVDYNSFVFSNTPPDEDTNTGYPTMPEIILPTDGAGTTYTRTITYYK